jgi:hypothetical protein
MLLGLGPIQVLAREMSAALQAEAAGTIAKAQTEGRRVEEPLTAKGVSFGRVAADPDGTLDRSGVEGVDADLTIRPFGWKGHQATLRGIAEESLHLHQGLLSNRIQLAVGDGSLGRGPYGQGPWYDVDEDGTSLEIHAGMLTTVVGYLAQLETPVMRPPRDPGLVDASPPGARVSRRSDAPAVTCRRSSSTTRSSTCAMPRRTRGPTSSTSPRMVTARRSSPSTAG